MRLSLADRTGVVAGLVWDDVEQASATAAAGEPVRVIGTFSEHPRYGPQVTVDALGIPLEVDWERLLDAPARPSRELERQLDELLASLRDPHLAALMDALLGAGSSTGRAFRRAFAAQYNHHAYRSRSARALAAGGRRDGARRARSSRRSTATSRSAARCCTTSASSTPTPATHCGVSLNDAGKLIGEIPSGYYTVRRAIEQIPGFPPELAQALLHIILSHHGCLEHGSPVLPSTREALVVHAMDKLSGDLGSFDRLERETAEDETWSRFDRALGRAVLLADRGTSLQTDEVQ